MWRSFDPGESSVKLKYIAGRALMREVYVPVWEQFTLSIDEAAAYFRIGESKLRRIVSENKDADFILWNGNRPQIKRTLFEKYIEKCNLI